MHGAQVKITKEVKEADAIVSTKLSRGGQHNKLQQVRRSHAMTHAELTRCGMELTRTDMRRRSVRTTACKEVHEGGIHRRSSNVRVNEVAPSGGR